MVDLLGRIGGEKILATREGAAEGVVGGGEFRRARSFRRSEAEAISSVQKMFEQSCIIPPRKNHIVSGILSC